MQPERLKRLLQAVRRRTLKVAEALEALKTLPYEDLGFARIDHHRALRQGLPEVIYCEGKTTEQVVAIAQRVHQAGSDVLATRARPEIWEALRGLNGRGRYHATARLIVLPARPAHLRLRRKAGRRGRILVIAAGTADLPVAEEARVTAETLGSRVEVLYDVGVAGLHRLLDQYAALRRARVLIVVAGMEAALPSVVGGLTDRPLIAVPTSVGYGTGLGGVAAITTMLNTCTPGVAVVNIDNGFGAGCLAHRINTLR